MLKTVLFAVVFVWMLVSQLSAQNFFLEQKENDASCLSYYITDINNKQVELPVNIQRNLECPPVIDLRGDVLILYEDNNMIWYNIAKKQQSVLIKLYNDIDGISNPVWSTDGKQIMFVITNQQKTHGYKEFGRILVLSVDETGKVVSKKKFDKPVHFTCGSVCNSSPGDDFRFKDYQTIEYRRHELIEDRPGEWETISLE